MTEKSSNSPTRIHRPSVIEREAMENQNIPPVPFSKEWIRRWRSFLGQSLVMMGIMVFAWKTEKPPEVFGYRIDQGMLAVALCTSGLFLYIWDEFGRKRRGILTRDNESGGKQPH